MYESMNRAATKTRLATLAAIGIALIALVACDRNGVTSSGGAAQDRNAGEIEFVGPADQRARFNAALTRLKSYPDLYAAAMELRQVVIDSGYDRAGSGGQLNPSGVFVLRTLSGMSIGYIGAALAHEGKHRQQGYSVAHEREALEFQIAACRRLGCLRHEIRHLERCSISATTGWAC